MKRLALFVGLGLSLSALADGGQNMPPQGQMQPQMNGQGGGYNQGNGQRFQERKENIIQRIDARLAHLRQKRDCVSEAQNHQALRQCMQDRDGMGGPGGGMGGPGGGMGGPGGGMGGGMR